jgi:hypothetical protein
MSKKAKVLRSALISLAFAATMPAAWAGGQNFSVSASDSTQPPRLLRVLDLKAPDIHDVMSADQIAAALPNPDETEVVDPETVQVHGAIPAPYVPSGFAALYWAVTHPLD